MDATNKRSVGILGTPPAKHPRHAHLGLRDLPESVIVLIFGLIASPVYKEPRSRIRALNSSWDIVRAPLPRSEHVAAVGDHGIPYLARDFGAHALAAVSPVFAAIFRGACVSTVWLLAPPFWRSPLPSGIVQPVFLRFPSADSRVLAYRNGEWDGVVPCGLGRYMDGSVVWSVTRLVLKGVALEFGDVDEISRAFPNLTEFVLLKCVLSDTDVALIFRKIGSRLLNMKFQGVNSRRATPVGMSLPPGFRVDDSAVFGGHGIVGMQELCVDKQLCITSQTFNHLALLPNLRRLNTSCTNFRDEDAAALSDLEGLKDLSVRGCSMLTYHVLASLPKNLEALDLSMTNVLSRSTPDKVFAISPPVVAGQLETLIAAGVQLANWLPLVDFSSLRWLSMAECTVTDIHLRRAVDSWPRIRVFDLRTSIDLRRPNGGGILQILQIRRLLRNITGLATALSTISSIDLTAHDRVVGWIEGEIEPIMKWRDPPQVGEVTADMMEEMLLKILKTYIRCCTADGIE